MLDVARMKRLYNAGGLVAYRVKYFDPITWTVKEEPTTCNEDKVKTLLKYHQDRGVTACWEMLPIYFDGAFDKLPMEKS